MISEGPWYVKKVQWTFDSDRRERRIKASLMTLLTSFDFDFSGVRSLRQKYWAWLAPIAKRPLAVPLMRHIDVAVALGNHTEVFLTDLLTAGSELSYSTCGGSLGGLSTGVGVNLGVYNNDVYIFAGSEDVVQTAKADVVSPTVTAEDLLALFDEDV